MPPALELVTKRSARDGAGRVAPPANPVTVQNRDVWWRTRWTNSVPSPASCSISSLRADACRAAGWWLCSILACAWAGLPSPAFAACLLSADPLIRELQTLVDTDAARALKQVRRQLDALESAPRPDTPRLAALYSVQAQAYSILELDEEARNAAIERTRIRGSRRRSGAPGSARPPMPKTSTMPPDSTPRSNPSTARAPRWRRDRSPTPACSSPAGCCNTGRTGPISRSAV